MDQHQSDIEHTDHQAAPIEIGDLVRHLKHIQLTDTNESGPKFKRDKDDVGDRKEPKRHVHSGDRDASSHVSKTEKLHMERNIAADPMSLASIIEEVSQDDFERKSIYSSKRYELLFDDFVKNSSFMDDEDQRKLKPIELNDVQRQFLSSHAVADMSSHYMFSVMWSETTPFFLTGSSEPEIDVRSFIKKKAKEEEKK